MSEHQYTDPELSTSDPNPTHLFMVFKVIELVGGAPGKDVSYHNTVDCAIMGQGLHEGSTTIGGQLCVKVDGKVFPVVNGTSEEGIEIVSEDALLPVARKKVIEGLSTFQKLALGLK